MTGRARDRRQAGVALLTALLIMVLATVAAVAMATRQQLDIRRTGNIVESDQAYLFTLGVESWAKEILARDREQGQVDHPGEDWATVLPPIAVEGAVVSGHIEDAQGRFNLNNLVDEHGAASEPDIQRLRRLLRAVELDERLADAVVDWIDPDDEPRFPDGAEDSQYLEMDPPYRAANAAMISTSELLLVKGFTPEAYAMLAPYVCALPKRTTINVNTAAVPVLMSLLDGLSAADAEQLIENRGDQGYQSVESFLADPVLKDRHPAIEGIGVSSDYFTIVTNATFGRNRADLSSLVARGDGGRVAVIMRSQGPL